MEWSFNFSVLYVKKLIVCDCDCDCVCDCLWSGNNFLYQEPGTSEDIAAFVESKHAGFRVMEKVDCGSSASAHPLFPFLTTSLPDTGMLSYLLGDGIKWYEWTLVSTTTIYCFIALLLYCTWLSAICYCYHHCFKYVIMIQELCKVSMWCEWSSYQALWPQDFSFVYWRWYSEPTTSGVRRGLW